MNAFRPKLLCIRARNLTNSEVDLKQLAGQSSEKSLDEQRAYLAAQLRLALDDCHSLGLSDATRTILRVSEVVESGRFDASRLAGEARRANDALMDDIEKRKYLHVPPELCKYLDHEQLFGELVYRKFTAARADIKEAGNCLAVGCSTAAVFHLMRVAEHGLRAIAKKLRVVMTHKGQPHPVEYADWDKVITGIKNKLASLRTMSHGQARQNNLEFYSDLADQCDYMRDMWRNTISHTRRPFNVPEAQGVLQRVEGFMVKLATGVRKAR